MNLFNKKKYFLKNILIFFLFLLVFFLFYKIFNEKTLINNDKKNNKLFEIFNKNKNDNLKFRKKLLFNNGQKLKKSGCILLELNSIKETCDLKNYGIESCFVKNNLFYSNPKCLKFDVFHVEKPERVRSIYYSSYGASRKDKINQLIELVKTTEVNSVVIDVKEINGEVYLKIPIHNFKKIKPVFDLILINPKDLIKKLHQNGIYIIARLVLFKDKNLANRRPDLAVKREDKVTVWKDYQGKKWVDPGSKEVWDYNLNIAREVYLLGFDEINLDYIRFPSDGAIRDTFYPFSQKEINKDKKWGRAKIMDKFYYYFTKKLKTEFPKIRISANVFGQVAINNDDISIGQILESTLLYFDTVSPMAYPSHYSKNFVPFEDGPDNHPYEVIEKTLKSANIKIEYLNSEIEKAQNNNQKIKIRENFYANLLPEEIIQINKIKKTNLRLWLQAFNCTWCALSKNYNQKEIFAQEKAIYDNGGDSWMLWNASSRYKTDFFLKE